MNPLVRKLRSLIFLNDEKQLPWNSAVGGASIGCSTARKPYVVLSIHQHELILSSFRGDYVFPKENVVALIRVQGLLLSLGLRIHHNLLQYPDFIVLWVGNAFPETRFERLKQKLEAFGYEVEE